jgi:short subunit dehydrogenase-like uncharacterized protein
MPDHDLVLFGATGFTGGLVAEHLARRANDAGSPPTRWAIAGRSTTSLKATRERLAAIDPALADLPLLQADVGDRVRCGRHRLRRPHRRARVRRHDVGATPRAGRAQRRADRAFVRL